MLFLLPQHNPFSVALRVDRLGLLEQLEAKGKQCKNS